MTFAEEANKTKQPKNTPKPKMNKTNQPTKPQTNQTGSIWFVFITRWKCQGRISTKSGGREGSKSSWRGRG